MLEDKIDKTIKETQREYERQKASGNFNSTVINDMNEYRRFQEYQISRPSIIRQVATGIISPVSFVLTPVILLGALAYMGGRAVYNKIAK